MAIVFIIFGIILWRVMAKADRDFDNSSAGKWLRQTREEQRRETMAYQQRKANNERLEKQARQLEQAARYGTPWERSQKRQQAEELRRQIR